MENRAKLKLLEMVDEEKSRINHDKDNEPAKQVPLH